MRNSQIAAQLVASQKGLISMELAAPASQKGLISM
jgi:hypothetical protein